ncbi:MAG: hypothetical protein ACRELY_31540 [Polyangiaceae bacterium]
MYLTAQHVRNPQGVDAYQAYLHLHDVVPRTPFPTNALLVPDHAPGFMVHKHTPLPPGSNAVLTYLDIMAPDALWDAPLVGAPSTPHSWWSTSLGAIGGLMGKRPLPWVVDSQGIVVVFNGLAAFATEAEYSALLQTAIALWSDWKTKQRLAVSHL